MNRPLTEGDKRNIETFLEMTQEQQRELLKAFIEWGYSDDLAGDFEQQLKDFNQL